MPEIVGPFNTISSSMSPLEGHISHLQHLTNIRIARDLLVDRFHFNERQARETAKLLGAHIAQSLEFHHQSRGSRITVRPVLQYYSYLNLAVAAILAYKPSNFNQYRQHGVEDRTHALSSLDLSSTVLKAKRGAVPLFHQIISDVSLYNKQFRFGHLVAGFHMVSHELEARFGKITQVIQVHDSIREISGDWYSEFSFTPLISGSRRKIAAKRLEDAMPLLSSEYVKMSSSDEQIRYRSIRSFVNEGSATRIHKKNGIKLVNYGGHLVIPSVLSSTRCEYCWRGVSRIPLLPTLTSLLLIAFSLASVARYRPSLLNKALNSPIHLIIDTFVKEADSIYIPTLRNLLYREETVISPLDFA